MNKKLVSFVVSAATLCSGVVFADCEPQFYVGGQAIASRLDFSSEDKSPVIKKIAKSLRKTRAGAGAFVGARFNENVGLEAGYEFLGKGKSTTSNAIFSNVIFKTIKMRENSSNAYVDVMGYLPVDASTDLIGSVGAGYLNTKLKATVTDTDAAGKSFSAKTTRHMVGPRVGVGAQYKVTDNIGARVMVNYQHGKKQDIQHMASAKVGMFYQF